jgi:hypothetical protein
MEYGMSFGGGSHVGIVPFSLVNTLVDPVMTSFSHTDEMNPHDHD